MFRVDLVEDAEDTAVLSDEKGFPEGSDPPLTLAPGPVNAVNGLARVGEKLEGEVVLRSEGVVRNEAVARDAEDLDVTRLQLLPAVAQAARFFSASGRVVLRVKVNEDVLLSAELGERNEMSEASGEDETRGQLTGRKSDLLFFHFPPASETRRIAALEAVGTARTR